jgi:hypothetical protein
MYIRIGTSMEWCHTQEEESMCTETLHSSYANYLWNIFIIIIFIFYFTYQKQLPPCFTLLICITWCRYVCRDSVYISIVFIGWHVAVDLDSCLTPHWFFLSKFNYPWPIWEYFLVCMIRIVWSALSFWDPHSGFSLPYLNFVMWKAGFLRNQSHILSLVGLRSRGIFLSAMVRRLITWYRTIIRCWIQYTLNIIKRDIIQRRERVGRERESYPYCKVW